MNWIGSAFWPKGNTFCLCFAALGVALHDADHVVGCLLTGTSYRRVLDHSWSMSAKTTSNT